MKGHRQVLASARVADSPSSDDWQTPVEILDRVRRIAPIALDPCSAPDNPTRAMSWVYPPDGDGLAICWRDHLKAITGGRLVYVNPPYSRVAAWAVKVAMEATFGAEVVTLVASRTDTRWFYRLVWDSASAVCFYRGRLRFVGAASGATFPSAIVYHGPRPWNFEGAFSDVGRVVRLRQL